MNIQSRLPDVGTTIFTVMSRMAMEEGAINLSQGFPDFPIDDHLIDLVSRFMREGHNQYAPMAGVAKLRKVIGDLILKTYGRSIDPESEITITPGATEAIYSSIAAFISPGDEVILFDPSYDSYAPAIRLNGGVPVHINLTFPEYSIDWSLVEQKISPHTRMIMINTPHNPSGNVLKATDLMKLDQLAEKHDLLVISDEVYERLIYDGVRHESVLHYPKLAARSLATFSFGKTFHATGWKVGYIIGPEKLMTEVRKAHQFIAFSVNTPVQLALATYLEDDQHVTALSKFYQQKRDYFLSEIKGSSFEPLATTGSYFQLLSYRNLSTAPDIEMATELTRRHKVASIPVSVFYRDKTDHQILRFCFAKREDTLEKACSILRKM